MTYNIIQHYIGIVFFYKHEIIIKIPNPTEKCCFPVNKKKLNTIDHITKVVRYGTGLNRGK